MMTEYENIIVNGELQTVLKESLDIPQPTERDIRMDRRDRLVKTDWWALSDLTMTQAQIEYRQALRDIPQQEGFPLNVVWPEKPE